MRTSDFRLIALCLALAMIAVGCGKKSETAMPETRPVTKAPAPVPAPTPPPQPAAPPAAEKKPAEAEKPAKEPAKVVIETTQGDLEVTLYPKEAPKTVERFLSLVREGYYDNMVWHRVVPDFVIQTGKGPERPSIPDEVNEHKHRAGALAMAKPGSKTPGRLSEPDSATTEFYVAMGEAPHLDEEFTVFGQVEKGLEVVKKITTSDRIKKIRIPATP